MVEKIFLVESPANVFAESMGRISNLIRTKNRQRRGAIGIQKYSQVWNGGKLI